MNLQVTVLSLVVLLGFSLLAGGLWQFVFTMQSPRPWKYSWLIIGLMLAIGAIILEKTVADWVFHVGRVFVS